MSYDAAFRFQQALDPSALVTLADGLNVLIQAIDECRRNQIDTERDPAVLLLARHIGNLATENRPPQIAVRRACVEAVGAAGGTPSLAPLAGRGGDYDSGAKAAFQGGAQGDDAPRPGAWPQTGRISDSFKYGGGRLLG